MLCIVNSSYPGKQTELFSIPLQAKGLCTSLSLGLSLLCVYLPDLNPGSSCISVSHFAFIFKLISCFLFSFPHYFNAFNKVCLYVRGKPLSGLVER